MTEDLQIKFTLTDPEANDEQTTVITSTGCEGHITPSRFWEICQQMEQALFGKGPEQ